MPYQNIDASLSESDLQEIREHLQAITTKLPFLVALTVDERRKLYKMGDKSLAFVTNSVNAAQAKTLMKRSGIIDQSRKQYLDFFNFAVQLGSSMLC